MFARLRLRPFTLLVLAWFVAAMGVASAAPAVAPVTVQWVCSASGDGHWVADDGGSPASPASAAHLAHCALCVAVAPPPAGTPLHQAWVPRSPRLTPYSALAPPGRDAAPPLPARGPPAAS